MLPVLESLLCFTDGAGGGRAPAPQQGVHEVDGENPPVHDRPVGLIAGARRLVMMWPRPAVAAQTISMCNRTFVVLALVSLGRALQSKEDCARY